MFLNFIVFFNNNNLVFCFEFLNLIIILIPILLAIAFTTIIERKLLAGFQKRIGPNNVGLLGLLQPFSDALKLIVKEFLIPKNSNKIIFNLSPIVSLIISLLTWLIIPFLNFKVFSNLNLGILYIFGLSSLHVYGLIMAGWSSNPRYAFLGALRSSSQLISYEVSIGLILISILLITNSLNLNEIILFQKHIWFIIPFFFNFLLFFISTIAESNRTPFDLPEAEGELVAGYNVEYSSSLFALFFISEYCNIIINCNLIIIFFLGGLNNLNFLNLLNFNFLFYIFNNYLNLYIIKFILVLYSYVWVRATLPRYRYDQLMRLGWKIFLPLSLILIFYTLLNLYLFEFINVEIKQSLFFLLLLKNRNLSSTELKAKKVKLF